MGRRGRGRGVVGFRRLGGGCEGRLVWLLLMFISRVGLGGGWDASYSMD